MNNPLRSVTLQMSIPFHDIDPMHVAWHGHYVKYFEIARTALFQQFDYDAPQMRDSGYCWPIIELNVRYSRSLTYQQLVNVQANLVEWENRIKIDYQINDATTGKRLTRGHTVQVAVAMPSGEMQFSSPAILFEKLGVAPA